MIIFTLNVQNYEINKKDKLTNQVPLVFITQILLAFSVLHPSHGTGIVFPKLAKIWPYNLSLDHFTIQTVITRYISSFKSTERNTEPS